MINSEPADTVFSGDPFTLTASAEGLTFSTYQWEIDGVQQSTTTNQLTGTAPELDEGVNSALLPVTLTVITEDGCMLQANTNLVILRGRVQIPGAFTPNGDGINDVFRVYHNTPTISVSQFTIYNRWGKLIFERSDNNGWDGTYQGEPAPSDVYLYHIVYRLGTAGQEQVVRGDVSLIR